MSCANLKVLLYPQTFLFPHLFEKVYDFLDFITILGLPSTLKIWETLYVDFDLPWKEKLRILSLKDDVILDWEELQKDKESLKEWGLNFRTPENLRYFSQFKEVLEDSLESLLPNIKVVKKVSKEEAEIKRALITLLLAEDLDMRSYELYLSLKSFNEKYEKILNEKIIGEDLTFQRIFERYSPTVEPYLSFESLSGLNSRVNAWNTITKYLKWEDFSELKEILITEKELLENWMDKFEFKEERCSEEVGLFRFKASMGELLNLPLKNFNFQETGVIFINS